MEEDTNANVIMQQNQQEKPIRFLGNVEIRYLLYNKIGRLKLLKYTNIENKKI